MNLIYPVICHFEDGGYWSEVPDLDGCFSQGNTKAEIVMNTKESMEAYLISILEDGASVPKASDILDHKAENGGFVTYIECNISEKAKSMKKNVTIPEWLGKLAEKANINFSKVLQNALKAELNIA